MSCRSVWLDGLPPSWKSAQLAAGLSRISGGGGEASIFHRIWTTTAFIVVDSSSFIVKVEPKTECGFLNLIRMYLIYRIVLIKNAKIQVKTKKYQWLCDFIQREIED